MRHDMMLTCQRKTRSRKNDPKGWEWVEVAAASLPEGKQQETRCVYCHGPVRVYKQRGPRDPQDHAEHHLNQDSENCRGVHYFNGKHKMSLQSLE